METLLEMGFDPDFSEYALSLNNDNIELAIQYMTKNKPPKTYKKDSIKSKVLVEEKLLDDDIQDDIVTGEIATKLNDEDDSIVYINCAGKEFATLMSTILPTKGTKFFRMITDESAEKYKGSVFIDRPEEFFEIILDTLRNGGDPMLRLDKENPKSDELLNEIVFYQLDNIFKKLAPMKIKGTAGGWRWIANNQNISATLTKVKRGTWGIKRVGGGNAWDGRASSEKPLTTGRHYCEILIEQISSDRSGTVFGLATSNSRITHVNF
jgi:hypothetical protein